ncbi:NACHT domain-containing protein [Nonomuraea solani]|uniref:hypothetical protein n=1 Tax=Nonomuraea solani TaxID=1144553 RepID=UPI00135912D9|nr:hypothetical protein [Nonomuraea solani]
MSRRPIRWWNPTALLAIVALVATVISVWRALKPDDPVNPADLAAVAIAASVAAAAVVTWAKRRTTAAGNPADVTRAAEVLADLVRRQWQDEARSRLLDDPEPIPVRWHLTANGAVMSTPRLISTATAFTFAGRSDDIAALASDFRALTRRRLVITGGAGMGKTTLAIQLLLQLLSTRATDQTGAGEGEIVPVPALLPVSGWDTGAHPRLQDWLTVRLAQDYPALAAPELGAGAAAALVSGGHILPVLDGLDEIPAPARAQVIAALNASLTTRDQLILTSRRAEFTTAIHEAGRPLTAAAVIVPQPLPPHAAADYLTACLPASPTQAWRQTLTALRSRTVPGLTQLAATPLGLWLIRTVYVTPGTDPAPLTGPLGADADALRTHLLDHVIPAVIAARPPSTDPADHFRPRHRLDPGATRRYLTYLAHAFPPATTRDITWWHIARTTPHIRSTVGIATGIAFGIAFGIVGIAAGTTFGIWYGTAPPTASVIAPRIALGLALGLALGITFGLTSGLVRARAWVNEKPGYADPRLRGRTSLLFRSIKGALKFGLTIRLTIGFMSGLTLALVASTLNVDLDTGVSFDPDGVDFVIFEFGFGFGLLFSLGTTLASGLITWAEQPTLASTSTPRSSWRADRALTLLRVVAAGLACGLVFGPLFGLDIGTEIRIGLSTGRWDWEELTGGLTIWLALGATLGLGAGSVIGKHHAWLVCTIAVAWLALQHRLPWRIMDFLDDVHRLGLLRAVGPVYQFRHAALHDHLAATDTSDELRSS